jgi:hypothetical protein
MRPRSWFSEDELSANENRGNEKVSRGTSAAFS